MTVTAVLGSELGLEEEVLWAKRFAESRNEPLLLVRTVRKKGAPQTGVEIDLADSDASEADDLTKELRALIEASPDLRYGQADSEASETPADAPDEVPPNDDAIPVRLREIHIDGDPLRILLSEISHSDTTLLLRVHRDVDTTSAEAEVRRQMFKRAPCELVLVRVGSLEGSPCSRILVAVGRGPHGRMAARLARDLARTLDASVTAMRVNPDIGDDARLVGARTLDRLLDRTIGKDTDIELQRHVEVSNKAHVGVTRAAEDGEHDVVIVGASKLGALGQKLLGTVGGKLFKGLPQSTVLITRAANPLASRFGHTVEDYLQREVPQLDRESRIALVERLQSSSQFNFDFFMLMALSTLIAAIGLIQSSAAVVIGAMLVAPLMTPILALGVALVQGNPVFVRITIRCILLGFVVALSASALVGLLSRFAGFTEPTSEMLARGGPGLRDLFVAFASGVAAAYASSRPNLLAALPGVAIAAALVPPIATAGLALSIGELKLAIAATLLYVINMFTIVLASQVSLWAVGIRNVKKSSHLTSAVGGGVIAGVVLLAVYLSIVSPEHDIDEVLPDPNVLVEDIREKLVEEGKRTGTDFHLRRVDVSHTVRGYELIVRVSGDELVPNALSDEVRSIARAHLDQPVQVRMVTEYDARPPGE